MREIVNRLIRLVLRVISRTLRDQLPGPNIGALVTRTGTMAARGQHRGFRTGTMAARGLRLSRELITNIHSDLYIYIYIYIYI